jgi:hypothetical protein
VRTRDFGAQADAPQGGCGGSRPEKNRLSGTAVGSDASIITAQVLALMGEVTLDAGGRYQTARKVA